MSSCLDWTIDEGRADRDNAPIANLNDGQANPNQNNHTNDNWNIGFRPAAVRAYAYDEEVMGYWC